MIPKDTLQLLIDTFAASRRSDVVTAPGEPGHVYYLRQPDGSLEAKSAEMPSVASAVCDLQTLARIAADMVEAAAAPGSWYTRKSVILTHGRDRFTVTLAPSPQLDWLITGDKAGRVTIDQAGFVRLLRTTLADCWGDHPKLLENVRKLSTSKAAKVDSEIQKGKVSVGKSMLAEMSGIELIPEEVTFRVPVFAAAALWVKAGVRVCVEPDPEREQFTLTVIPGQIEAAWAAGEAWIAAKLSGELSEAGATTVPVYFGSP